MAITSVFKIGSRKRTSWTARMRRRILLSSPIGRAVGELRRGQLRGTGELVSPPNLECPFPKVLPNDALWDNQRICSTKAHRARLAGRNCIRVPAKGSALKRAEAIAIAPEASWFLSPWDGVSRIPLNAQLYFSHRQNMLVSCIVEDQWSSLHDSNFPTQ